MSTFDYIEFDAVSLNLQADIKEQFEVLTKRIERLNPNRAKSLALTKLEESYMWVGKAIRDSQLESARIEKALKGPGYTDVNRG